ncbi:MAG: hypothetical protein HOI07_05885 [Betaproteobacteria bacterium]|jgi:hypothetical protein|nr:hypothetical protein [Betaproteobacteria bacterium]
MDTRILSLLIITLTYGLIYSLMPKEEFGFKTALDPFYFSFTTMSTVGYGDISPKTDRAKLMVMTQQAALIVELSTILQSVFIIKK